MALLPTFSIRQLLIAMIGVAFLSACLAGAYRGNLIFYGMIVGIVTMIVSIVGLGVAYWLALLIAKMSQSIGGRRSVKEKLIWLAIAIGSLLSSTTLVLAQSALPPGKSGYSVTFDDQYPSNGTGYRTVRIQLETNPKLPVKKDVSFQVTISSRDYGTSSQTTTSVPLLLQSGQSVVSAELYVPRASVYGNQSQQLLIEREVFDGQYNPRRDFVYELGGNVSINSQFDFPAVLFISSAVSPNNGFYFSCCDGKVFFPGSTTLSLPANEVIPSFDKLVESCTDATNNTVVNRVVPNANANITNSLTGITMVPQIHAVHPAELPQDWIGLSSVEEVLISLDELKKLASAHDVQRDSLEKWVAAGGTLVVTETGISFEHADQVSKLLLGAKRAETLEQNNRLWREPSPQQLQIQKPIITTKSGNNYYYNNTQPNSIQLDDVEVATADRWIERDSVVGLKTESKFLIGQHVRGRLVVVADTMNDWSPAEWRRLQNGIQLAGKSLAEQIGLATGDEKVLFKIPGVGEPPVIVFQILIGLFILLAGPGIYIVLSRTGQMQLFFLLVPLLSLSVCMGLVGYATIVDGFESWGRVQSVTWVDHRSESAVTHSRCAYFCGTQPSPYRFSRSIVPIALTSENSRVTQTWQSSAGLTIAGGDIRSRTPHQIVAIRSHQLEQRLRWLPPQVGADGVKATNDLGTFRNQLGSDVMLAVARTEAGWVFVENLATDQFLPAQATDSFRANVLLSALTKDLPISTYTSDQQLYYGPRAGSAGSQGSEYNVVEALQQGRGTDYLDQPNTYIAILESFSVVNEQIEPVQYKKQMHVIIGKW